MSEATSEASLAVAEPAPAAAPAPAPQPLPLAELYPACFDRESPRPLKIGVYRDLLAAGFGEAEVEPAQIKRALGCYCHRPRSSGSWRSAACGFGAGPDWMGPFHRRGGCGVAAARATSMLPNEHRRYWQRRP